MSSISGKVVGCKNPRDFFTNAPLINAITISLVEVWLIPNKVFQVREKILLILVRKVSRENSTGKIINKVSIPSWVLYRHNW